MAGCLPGSVCPCRGRETAGGQRHQHAVLADGGREDARASLCVSVTVPTARLSDSGGVLPAAMLAPTPPFQRDLPVPQQTAQKTPLKRSGKEPSNKGQGENVPENI